MMQPENVTEISNLLVKTEEKDFLEEIEESEQEENSIDIDNDDDIDDYEVDLPIKPIPTLKQKNDSRKLRVCLSFLLVIVLAGLGVGILFVSPKKFRINENSESNSMSTVSFKFEPNKIISGEYNETLAVKCQNGIFVGSVNDNVISFKGIPYAKPPTGNLRWKPPVKPDDSKDVHEAYNFGYSPIQTQWKAEAASYYKQSEDCLTLNIWTDHTTMNDSKNKKPVMVFIHGGSYGWGGTVDPMYDGYNFVKKHPEIILVTINYRLGIMGFIDFSSLKGGDAYKESGNLGILDQIQALKWIKENIAGFGGDPENITLFGESSGAGSASILAVIPEAKGLFKRIIAQSGSIALTYSKEECQKLTQLLLKEANADNLDDILTLSEDVLKEINVKLNDYSNFPERDGIIIPEDLYQVYQDGASKDIDILIGTNEDESRYWIRAFGNEYLYQMAIPVLYENNMKEVSKEDKKYADKFIRLQETSYPWSISRFYNEVLFRIPAMEQAIQHSKNGGNAYMYYWTYSSSSKNLGLQHSIELSYAMGNFKDTSINEELATTVQNMWVNFATSGNPNIVNGTTWEKFTSNNKKSMVLGETIEMKDRILEEQYILIKPLLKYHFNGCYTDLNYNVNYVQKVVIGCLCILLAIIILPVIIFRRK